MADPFALLWPALAAVPGMLDEATIQLQDGNRTILVAYQEPDHVMFDGAAHASQYQIEFQISDLMEIRRNTLINIRGKSFKAAGTSKVKTDGRFAVVDLEEV